MPVAEDDPCPYIISSERVKRALPADKKRMIDLRFLNNSMRIPAIKNQALLRRVTETLMKMEGEAKKLVKTKANGACQRPDAVRKNAACQRDIQQQARVGEPYLRARDCVGRYFVCFLLTG